MGWNITSNQEVEQVLASKSAGRSENRSIDSSERIGLETECEKVLLIEDLSMEGNWGR